jgi:beta-N-acetylhexosaminidase
MKFLKFVSSKRWGFFCGLPLIGSLLWANPSLPYLPQTTTITDTLHIVPKLTIDSQKVWVDSVLANLSNDQKIGQLFIVTTYSNKDEAHAQRIERLIADYHIGGLIFIERGNPVSQASLTNRYQAQSKIPLLIGFDAEWGLGFRMPLVIDLPKPITVGAVQDPSLPYQMGEQLAKQCRRVGVHINFAPSVDVNSNPKNPIIGYRSFGENRENVSMKGIAYVKGMQHNKVIACAKHFPGHGDTYEDSHRSLPVILHAGNRLDTLELYPFKRLIADSVMSIITGHLLVPYYDNKAASISEKITTKLLREDLCFDGLVITDALNMRGITRTTTPGELDLLAFKAGNDILLMSENVHEGIRRIKDALAKGEISQEALDNRVRKIITAKYFVGLNKYKPVDMTNLMSDINNDEEAISVKRHVYEHAITLVKNDNNHIPFSLADSAQYVSVAIGEKYGNAFQKTLSDYATVQSYNTENRTDEGYLNDVLSKIDSTKTVIVSLHQNELKNLTPQRGYGISKAQQDFVARLRTRTKKIAVVIFGSPYSLKYFEDVPMLVCAYENDTQMQYVAAELLFGALPAQGKLPISATETFGAGHGLTTEVSGRLIAASPESVEIDALKLKKIDAIVGEAIDQQAFPGCQVLVARKGKIFFKKNYGLMAYNSYYEPVKDQTIYDLASVTKVTATLQAIMWLYDHQLLDLSQAASTYLPELKGTNKEKMIIRDILCHQAGLVAYMPFWERTRTTTGFKPEFYSTAQSDTFSLQVAEYLWAKPTIRDSMWRWIVKTPLINKRDREGNYSYVYSDLGLMMLQKIVEKLSNQPLNEFVQKVFYAPLQLKYTTYTPLLKGINIKDIAPTENDVFFRKAQLRGTVQDQQAAMLGGVSGHAGLFSNASDLAILMQMNLQQGFYGGRRFFNTSTVDFFAQNHSNRSHRGLGWDKRPDDGDSNYISTKASPQGYGHSGYTGTLVWNDPQYDLVFIFLSNRVYTSAANSKINTLKIRRKIMDVVYEAMK